MSGEAFAFEAPCGLLTTTPDGVIIDANKTFLRLIRYARDDVIGHIRFVDLLSAGGRIYHETHYAPMLQMHGEAGEIALDLMTKASERLPVLINAVLQRDDAGEPVAIHVAVFEARERREYERELLRAKQRAEDSEARATALARTLQQTLIPPAPPAIPHLHVSAEYRPAGDGTEVGGDFYDIFQLGPDDWAIAIGDVRGKGAEAAVITALARYTLRAAAVQDPSPAHALGVLNDVLLQHASDRFCTLLLLRLRRQDDTWQVLLGVAGHPLPLKRRHDGGVEAVGRPGSLLGVMADAELTETTFSLAAGELLVLYTDGVSEGRRGREFYGERRISTLIESVPAEPPELTGRLLDDVLAFQGGVARDDMAIVAIGVPRVG